MQNENSILTPPKVLIVKDVKKSRDFTRHGSLFKQVHSQSTLVLLALQLYGKHGVSESLRKTEGSTPPVLWRNWRLCSLFKSYFRVLCLLKKAQLFPNVLGTLFKCKWKDGWGGEGGSLQIPDWDKRGAEQFFGGGERVKSRCLNGEGKADLVGLALSKDVLGQRGVGPCRVQREPS